MNHIALARARYIFYTDSYRRISPIKSGSRPRGRMASGRVKVPSRVARGISVRLGQWLKIQGYKTHAQFAAKIGVPASTVGGWFETTLRKQKRVSDPRTPELAYLVTLGKAEGVNLDWLLLGRGAEYYGAQESCPELQQSLRQYLLLRLRRPNDSLFNSFLDQHLPMGETLLAAIAGDFRDNIDAKYRVYRGSVRQNLAGEWTKVLRRSKVGSSRYRLAESELKAIGKAVGSGRETGEELLYFDLVNGTPTEVASGIADLDEEYAAAVSATDPRWPSAAQRGPASPTEIAGPAIELTPAQFEAWQKAGRPMNWRAWRDQFSASAQSGMTSAPSRERVAPRKGVRGRRRPKSSAKS